MMLFIVGVLIIAMIIIINYLYKRTNHYKNMISNIKKFLDGVDENIELASFGSSYAKYGIIPEEIKEFKTFNFGIQPESLNYDFKMLKMYIKKLKNNCIVLINIPSLVFTFVDYKSDRSNTKYYYFLDKKYINKYKWYKSFLNKYLPIIKDPFLIRYVLKDVRINDYEKRLVTKLDEEGVKKEALIRIKGWKENAKIESTEDSFVSNEMEDIFKENQKILEEIIEYCMKNNCRPVIIIPPVSKELLQMLSKDFLNTYLYENIDKANKRKIPVLNYLEDSELQDYKLYINSDFLNLTGRKKLTQKILEDLRKINYI